MVKIEIFPLCMGHSCNTLRVENSLKITLSLMAFEIFTLFHFPLYLLRFSRYSHFFIFHKNPRWPPKVAKIEIFPLCIGHSCNTLRVKNSLKIALSLTVFEIFTPFHFPLYLLHFSRYSHFFTFRKNPRWLPKVAKIEIFPLSMGQSCNTLRVKNLLEIALSLKVFEIFTLFHFPQKSKMATKSGEN